MSELCPVVAAVPVGDVNEPQAATAAEALLSALKKKLLCDVTFVFDNSYDKIEAHQFCLRARSPVFDSMFRGLGPVAIMKEVKIENASPEIVEKFLEFIYADKFDVTTVQALHLLNLGLKYKVQPLIEKCEARIGEGISSENAIEVYEAAETYKLTDLRAQAGDIIARSLEHILENPKLLKAKQTTLVTLLKRDDLTVKEIELFQLAVQWGKENSSGDQKLASVLTAVLLPCIRFTNMTPQEITTVVWPTSFLPAEDIIKIYAYINGDDPIRNAISPSLKYETSQRNVDVEGKFETTITFVSEHERSWECLQNAQDCFPYKEYISFSTSLIGSHDKGKKFKIKSIIVKWPTREVESKSSDGQPPVNFRVLVMMKQSSHEHYTTKFDTVVYDCRNQEESMAEVAVDPAVEIFHDFDYCVAVVDEYSGTATTFRYVQDNGYIEITANPDDYILEEDELELKMQIRDTKRNDCPKACAKSSSYNAMHVIRDICFVVD